MSQRLNEYLVREAGGYLDQMVALLRAPGIPDPGELLRLARGARGSTQMAGATALASLSVRLEDAARAAESGAMAWGDELRALVRESAEEMRLLLATLERWGAEEESRVRALLARWEGRSEDVVSISALFYDDEGPHVLSRPASSPVAAESVGEEEGEVVPVESLLLRGDDALREALALRDRVESLLAGSGDPEAAAALLDELFDLVRLGQTEGRPAA